jgi:hypothetical protein
MARPNLLGDNSRRLTALREGESYAWLSPDSLLILRPQTAANPGCLGNLLPVALARASQVTHTAFRRMLSTGEETPMEVFNGKHASELLADVMVMHYPGNVGRRQMEVKHHPPEIAVSPKGRWLLWPLRSGAWRAARLDGSACVAWSLAAGSAGGRAVWLPGSGRWLETVPHYEGKRRNATATTASSGFVIPALRLRRCNDPTYERMVEVTGLEDGLIAGITARYSLWMHHPDWAERRAAGRGEQALPTHTAVSETPLRGRRVEARRFEIALPLPGSVWSIQVSPQGDRLAWLIEHPANSDEHGMGGYPAAQYSLWTSDLAGGAVHEVGWASGHIEASEESATGVRYAFPHEPKWSPDGSHISFTYGEAVFAVAVA